MHRLFVTGTDTGVGKTLIASGLCTAFVDAGQRVAGMKPIASGCVASAQGLRNSDALALMDAMNVRASYDEVNPYAFAPAIAPHIAAVEADCSIDFERLDRCYERLSLQSQVTIVEGAGGWLAPLDATHAFADLAVRWQLDVVLVVGLRLGCLNHALLTLESVQRRGLRLAAWVANTIDPNLERRDENVATLRTLIDAPCLGDIPHTSHASAAFAANILAANLRELRSSIRP